MKRPVGVIAAAAVAFALMSGAPLSAHPASLTTVSIAVGHARTVEVVLTTPADALITKLELAPSDATIPAAPVMSGSSTHASLVRLTPRLLGGVTLRVNGSAVRLAVTTIEIDQAGVATIRMSVPIPVPAGDTQITWQSRFVYGSYPVAIDADGRGRTVQWVEGLEQTQPVLVGSRSRLGLLGRGLVLGFTHIVPGGLDHILFIVGLTLLSGRRRQLLLLVTTFTLAHSITLALSLYGLVTLPSRIVEPLIAASVAYVGLEQLLKGRFERARFAVVFSFGLLHGLGFAEALASLHLSRPELEWMLVSFNTGVEAGQITVLGLVLALLWALTRSALTRPWPVARLASGLVGLTGLVWTVERIF